LAVSFDSARRINGKSSEYNDHANTIFSVRRKWAAIFTKNEAAKKQEIGKAKKKL